jgi:hypothetical protein
VASRALGELVVTLVFDPMVLQLNQMSTLSNPSHYFFFFDKKLLIIIALPLPRPTNYLGACSESVSLRLKNKFVERKKKENGSIRFCGGQAAQQPKEVVGSS